MTTPGALLPLLVICGPTGSGKSALAIALAREFHGEVINCDSLQVYRHFDIGTAKLPEAERGGIPHHLIDVAEGAQGFTAGDFARLARSALRLISPAHLPILAGGAGFYLKALLEGLPQAPVSDAALRLRLLTRERNRPGSLHRILARLDPESARRIHPRDVPKTIRALEIRLLSSRNASSHTPPEPLSGYRVLTLGLFPPRDELHRTLDRRCQAMLEGGLLTEIESLLAAGIPRTAKPFLSIGYKEGLAVLDGRMTFDQALEEMRRATRRYAKRQITWFRHQSAPLPIERFGHEPAAFEAARRLVTEWLHAGRC